MPPRSGMEGEVEDEKTEEAAEVAEEMMEVVDMVVFGWLGMGEGGVEKGETRVRISVRRV